MKEKKRKRKKPRKREDKKLQKPTFYEFARSELDEVKIVGGFFIVLSFIFNYDTLGWFFVTIIIVIVISLFILYAAFKDWIRFLRSDY